MTINNVRIENLARLLDQARSDPGKLRRTNRVSGTWNLQPGKPQFAAEVSFEGGKATLETDQPGFQGGGGSRPGPIQYCLFGLASCYTASFVTVAAMEGVALKEVHTEAESDVNMSPVFGLSQAPIIEEARVTLRVKADIPDRELERLAKLAEERCPAVYCLTNPIRLVARVSKV